MVPFMSSQPPPPPSGPFGPPPTGPDQPYPPAPAPTQPMPQQPPVGPYPGQPGPAAPFPGQPGPPPMGGGFGGLPPAGPGGPGYSGPGGPGYGGMPPGGPAGEPKKRGLLWIAIGAVVAIAIGAGVYVATKSDDKVAAPVITEPDVTLPPITLPPSTTVAETTTTEAPTTTVAITLPPTLPPITTSPPETTAPADPNTVDLGHGVTFALPDGYTSTPSDSGSSFQLENGTVSAFFQVLERTPGESPLVLLQEYVDTFDTTFDSVVYSQVIPSPPVDAGAAPADSNLVFYRALNADGTGVKGVIDANRRADGLSYVSDIFLAIDADTDNKFPSDSINELFNSYLNAPLIGATAPLTPLSFTRVTTTHTPYVVDGLVALTPPAGWTVDAPGPGRVVMSRPDGQRFLGEKIANLSDMASAQAAAQATVLSLVPGSTFGDFTTDTASDENFTSTRWGGTDPNTGQPLQGFISVWFDITTGEAFDSLEAWIGPGTDPPSQVESDFLFQAFDTSISKARA